MLRKADSWLKPLKPAIDIGTAVAQVVTHPFGALLDPIGTFTKPFGAIGGLFKFADFEREYFCETKLLSGLYSIGRVYSIGRGI